MRSGFILLSVFVFSVSSAQYKGQNIRVDSLKANAMILQSGELPLGWPQDTLRVVIDTVNSIAPKVNKLYTGDDDEGGILPPSMVRDSIRYAIENAVGGGIPMPDTTEQGGKFLRYNGTEETPFDWAVAGSDSGNFAKLSGGNIFSGAQNATDFRASDSVTANVVKSVTTTTDTLKATSIYIALSGRFRSIYGGTFGYMSYDTIVYNASGNPSATTNMIQLGPVSVIHAQGLDFSTLPIRSSGGRFKFSDWNRELVGNGRPHIEGASAPHQLLIFERGGPATYLSNDDLAVTGFNYTTNSNLATQAAAVKGIDVRNNIGGAHPLGVYTANGSYTPAQAFGGHFELNNYARAKIPIGYGVRARVNNAHSNDSTRYGFAAGFKFSQPFWSYGGYDTLYGIHLDDPKYGDVRAAIGLRDTGLIAWKWDTFLKRTSAGTLGLDTNLTVTGTTTTANATVTGTTTLNTSLTGTLRASSGVVSATASDTVGLAVALAGKSGPVDSANFVKRDEIFRLNVAGLVDSIKTSDTLFLGYNVAGYTLDTIRYFSDIGKSLTARIEMVDSLYQRSGATLIDTTTCTLSNTIQAGANIDSATLTQGKVLRVVFPTVGTMPRQFIIVLIGHRT